MPNAKTPFDRRPLHDPRDYRGDGISDLDAGSAEQLAGASSRSSLSDPSREAALLLFLMCYRWYKPEILMGLHALLLARWTGAEPEGFLRAYSGWLVYFGLPDTVEMARETASTLNQAQHWLQGDETYRLKYMELMARWGSEGLWMWRQVGWKDRELRDKRGLAGFLSGAWLPESLRPKFQFEATGWKPTVPETKQEAEGRLREEFQAALREYLDAAGQTGDSVGGIGAFRAGALEGSATAKGWDAKTLRGLDWLAMRQATGRTYADIGSRDLFTGFGGYASRSTVSDALHSAADRIGLSHDRIRESRKS